MIFHTMFPLTSTVILKTQKAAFQKSIRKRMCVFLVAKLNISAVCSHTLVRWAVLARIYPAGWGKWVFPIVEHLKGHIWSAVPSLRLPSMGERWTDWSKCSEGPQTWLGLQLMTYNSRSGFVQLGQTDSETSDCCPQLSNSVYEEGREDTFCREENYDYL